MIGSKRPMGKATREAFGAALIQLGEQDHNVVSIDADLSKSTQSGKFGDLHPDRFFNVGIAEANMVSIGVGLAAAGKVPFCSSFSSFMINKGFEQIRVGCGYNKRAVKFVGSHAGISLGEDGPSQMATEDLALMLTMPGFCVFAPADFNAGLALTKELYAWNGPGYLRVGRPKTPVIYEEGTPFPPGGLKVVREGKDVLLAACGVMVDISLTAADALEAEHGISATVVDLYSLKPFPGEELAKLAAKHRVVVTAEEHGFYGGLNSLVCQELALHHPMPVARVAVNDTYAQSGKPDQLFERYGLSPGHVVNAAVKALSTQKQTV